MRKHAIISDHIDQKETAANVATLLEDYPHMKRIAWATAQLQEPDNNNTPVDARNLHIAENRSWPRTDAQGFLDACNKALSHVRSMAGEREADLVYYSCFKELSAAEVMDMLHYSKSSYYLARRRALVCFASAWPVKNQELLINKL